jgi:hypothetical protein
MIDGSQVFDPAFPDEIALRIVESLDMELQDILDFVLFRGTENNPYWEYVMGEISPLSSHEKGYLIEYISSWGSLMSVHSTRYLDISGDSGETLEYLACVAMFCVMHKHLKNRAFVTAYSSLAGGNKGFILAGEEDSKELITYKVENTSEGKAKRRILNRMPVEKAVEIGHIFENDLRTWRISQVRPFFWLPVPRDF